jgi:hypothetical protein
MKQSSSPSALNNMKRKNRLSGTALLSCALFVTTFFPNAASAQETLRKWQASNGDFSVEATLVDVQAEKIQLKKKDGTLIWVDLNKLSQDDVRFVKQNNNKKANSSSIKSDSPKPSTSKNKKAIDNVVTVPPELDFFVGAVTTMDLAIPATKSTFIGWTQRDKSGTKARVADLTTGQTSEPFNITTKLEGKSLSPDGKMFATFGGNPVSITIYSPTSGEIIRELQPAEFRGVQAIAFLSPQEIMVQGNSNNSGGAIYETKSGKLLRWLEIPSLASQFEVSSDGKILAVHQRREFFRLIDTKTGIAKAEIKLEGDKDFFAPTLFDLSFCNQDRELGVLCSGSSCGFRIYDSKSGKLKAKHSLKKSIQEIAHWWEDYKAPAVETLPKEKGWILYGRAVVDPKLGGPIWLEQPKGIAPMSIYRPLLNDELQLVLAGDYEKQRLKTTPLPWAEIEQSRSNYR